MRPTILQTSTENKYITIFQVVSCGGSKHKFASSGYTLCPVYDKENNAFRTEEVNEVFSLIARQMRSLEEKKQDLLHLIGINPVW